MTKIQRSIWAGLVVMLAFTYWVFSLPDTPVDPTLLTKEEAATLPDLRAIGLTDEQARQAIIATRLTADEKQAWEYRERQKQKQNEAYAAEICRITGC